MGVRGDDMGQDVPLLEQCDVWEGEVGWKVEGDSIKTGITWVCYGLKECVWGFLIGCNKMTMMITSVLCGVSCESYVYECDRSFVFDDEPTQKHQMLQAKVPQMSSQHPPLLFWCC